MTEEATGQWLPRTPLSVERDDDAACKNMNDLLSDTADIHCSLTKEQLVSPFMAAVSLQAPITSESVSAITSKSVSGVTSKRIISKIQCIKIGNEHGLALDVIPTGAVNNEKF